MSKIYDEENPYYENDDLFDADSEEDGILSDSLLFEEEEEDVVDDEF